MDLGKVFSSLGIMASRVQLFYNEISFRRWIVVTIQSFCSYLWNNVCNFFAHWINEAIYFYRKSAIKRSDDFQQDSRDRSNSLKSNIKRGLPELKKRLDALVGDKRIKADKFVQLFDSKNKDFARRLFNIFLERGSSNGEEKVSLDKEQVIKLITETVQLNDDEQLKIIFQVHDLNDDGSLSHQEVRSFMKASITENGLEFREEDVTKLTEVFMQEADENHNSMIEFEELKKFLYSYDGLVESMLRSFARWLLLRTAKYARPEEKDGPMVYQPRYLKNNVSSVIAFLVWICINIGLFGWRFYAFLGVHPFVSVARGAGMCLNFNSSLIMVFILRRTITILRMWGLADYIPLDKNIKYHKYCGFTILFFALLHTFAHILNFARLSKGDFGYLLKLLFGVNPELFSFCGGAASITGWICLGALLIIFVSSLPFVRKTGHFEIFYYFHLFYVIFWLALITHGPNFWIWILTPGIIFIIERIIHVKRMMGAPGHTYLVRGLVLPSGVTQLVIRRPPDFIYHPGDWLFLQIPDIATSEWHPFTISSAPEMPDHLFLHIRSAGGWTSRLRKIFEEHEARGRKLVEAHSPLKDNPTHPNKITHRTTGRVMLDFTPKPQTSQETDSSGVYIPGSTSKDRNGRSKKAKFDTADPSRQRPVFDKSEDLARRLAAICDAGSSKRGRIIEFPRPIGRFFDDDQSQFYPGEVIHNRGDIEKGEFMKKSPISEHQKDYSGQRESPREISSRIPLIFAQSPITVKLDGPYGSPSSHIFNTEHAVLVATGIGVTPFAAILQSIMFRYVKSQQTCPYCDKCWLEKIPVNVMKLRKVDFVWLNRDAKCFEWFVHLLSQLEVTQSQLAKGCDGDGDRFLDMHIYITSAKENSDIRSVGLHLALDLMHKKEERDLITGLRTRTKPGRPDWGKFFQRIDDNKKGKVSVFYCGAPILGKELKKECDHFQFSFHKENF